MSRTDSERLLGRWLDGDLDQAGADALATELKDDPEARRDLSRYEALEALAGALRTAPAPRDDLVAAVMARIATRKPPRRPLWRRLADLVTASPWRLAGAGGLAVAMGLALGLLVARTGPGPRRATGSPIARAGRAPISRAGRTAAAPGIRPVDLQVPGPAVDAVRGGRAWVTFVFRDGAAHSVAVAGSFNHWARAPMTRTGAVWHLTVPMKQGRQEYLFVVDGHRWVVDPAAPAVAADGFGGHNAVLQL